MQLDERFDTADTAAWSAEERLLQQSAADRLRNNVSQLSGDCQRLLRMMLEGRNTDEMRSVLGLTGTAYYTRLCRCRKKLVVIMGWQE